MRNLFGLLSVGNLPLVAAQDLYRNRESDVLAKMRFVGGFLRADLLYSTQIC